MQVGDVGLAGSGTDVLAMVKLLEMEEMASIADCESG